MMNRSHIKIRDEKRKKKWNLYIQKEGGVIARERKERDD